MPYRFAHCIHLFSAAAALLLFCGELPVDPMEDPKNASVTLFLKDGGDPVVEYKSARTIGLELRLTHLIDSIRIYSECVSIDTQFIVDSTRQVDTVWVKPEFNFEGQCVISAEATMHNHELKNRTDSLSLRVLPEKPDIRFLDIPSAVSMTENECDTLRFITAVTGGAKVPAEYTLSVSPEDGSGFFTTEYSAIRDTAYIIAAPTAVGEYSLTLAAATTYNDNMLSDTTTVTLTVTEHLAPSFVSIPEQLIAGKVDTLVFTVDNSARPDPLTIVPSTDPPLDTSVFSIVPTGADSIVLAVSETAQAGTATIGIITRTATQSDTSWYPVSIQEDTTGTVATEPEDTSSQHAETVPAVITTQPSLTDSVFAGDTIILSVEAEGTPAPEYQWYINSDLIEGATNATFMKTDATTDDNGTYSVVVNNDTGTGISSDTVEIHVFTKVQITENPQSTPVNEGDDVVFSVTATGDAPLSYQWLMNGDPVGEDDSVHTLRSVTPQDSGLRYSCIASNAFSCDTSLEAVLSVTATPIYTVKFDTDGGSSVDSQRVKEGDTTKQPEEDPVKSEHEFAGWYPSKTSETVYDFSTAITTPTTIVAMWLPVYRITYDANGGTGSVTDTTLYKGGDWATVMSGSGLARSEYTFDKWTTEQDGSGNPCFSGSPFKIGSSSVTLWAQWIRNKCTITFDGNGATTAPSPASISIDVGSPVGTFPTEPKKTGYVFFGWKTGEGGTENSVSVGRIINSSITLHAKWVIMDVDRNIYTEVKIGNQVWMVENLKTTRLNDNIPITFNTEQTKWTTATTPAFCWYGNELGNKYQYGALYNWFAVETNKLAPEGWHVPTDNDFRKLNSIQGALGGWRDWLDGSFNRLGEYGAWWTATEYDSESSVYFNVAIENPEPYQAEGIKNEGMSVRCIRDY